MKQLISAADIRQAKSDKKTYLVAPAKDFIITPEAREVAKVEGIELLDIAPAAVAIIPEPKLTMVEPINQLELIQAEIEAQLPHVDLAKSDQIQQLIANAMVGFNQQLPASPRQINDDGIVLIRGNAIKLDVFDGAPGKNIGLTDVIGAKEGSNMGVGYMGWENAFFPWTLNYDEVNVVLEGELHVKTTSGTTIAKPGEVIFIPKNSSVEFGTPTHVRYVYITYPVEWA
ncbi:ethanolamine utilization acetate kinase EutQ [Photobacterium carnosum]|uniref:ethanolamine utilization acetate kinase EutQ n=1 Tax=Photobacterium carnosum TaxID=2023717 RepID=UPI001E61F9A9|nr:ethanolamine utilization acetate kinase EutQ [Photobacterium carnosum]MCD9522966.1 ethanolamine utilization acetate kinase EutQ [Photobacterium carnosum]